MVETDVCSSLPALIRLNYNMVENIVGRPAGVLVLLNGANNVFRAVLTGSEYDTRVKDKRGIYHEKLFIILALILFLF